MLLKTLCNVFETATYFDKLRNLSTNSSDISSLSVERETKGKKASTASKWQNKGKFLLRMDTQGN